MMVLLATKIRAIYRIADSLYRHNPKVGFRSWNCRGTSMHWVTAVPDLSDRKRRLVSAKQIVEDAFA